MTAIGQPEQSQFNVIPEAINVKGAQLVKIGNDNKYVVLHYNSIILEIVNDEVILLNSHVQSSNRACNQALKYLNSKLTVHDIKLLMRSNVEKIMIKEKDMSN